MKSAKTKKTTKIKNLIKEQNKSLILVCVVMIVVIGIAGLATFTSSSNKNTDPVPNVVDDNGIVDDMGILKDK